MHMALGHHAKIIHTYSRSQISKSMAPFVITCTYMSFTLILIIIRRITIHSIKQLLQVLNYNQDLIHATYTIRHRGGFGGQLKPIYTFGKDC